MAEAEDWLPRSAFLDGVVETAALKAFRVWLEKWLPDGVTGSVRLLTSAHMPPALNGSRVWRNPGDVWCLSVPPIISEFLAARLLDAGPLPRKRTPADQTFIDELVGAAVLDLLAAFADAGLVRGPYHEPASGPAPEPESSVAACALEIRFGNSLPPMQLTLSHSAWTRLRKSVISRRAPPIELVPLEEAIGGLNVRLGASLGGCAVRPSDFSGLSPGDVLVLDQLLSEPLALAVSGVSAARARCVLEPAGEFLGIRLIGDQHV